MKDVADLRQPTLMPVVLRTFDFSLEGQTSRTAITGFAKPLEDSVPVVRSSNTEAAFLSADGASASIDALDANR